jgi:hypothetical protein
MPFTPEPLTDDEQKRYEAIEIGANAHHKTHGAGSVVAKDDTGVTIEIFNSVSSSASSRSFRLLIENEEERERENKKERANTMVIKVPKKIIVDEFGAWRIDKEFGRVLLKTITKYLEDTPSFIDLAEIPKAIEVGAFSRRIKELKAVNYNDTNSLMQHIAQCVDNAAFTWAREVSKTPVDEQQEAYQKALDHLGKDAWINIFHVHSRNTDSERRVVESMLLNITNKSVEDIYDYQSRRDAALQIYKSIEKRAADVLREYITDQFEIVSQENAELEINMQGSRKSEHAFS